MQVKQFSNLHFQIKLPPELVKPFYAQTNLQNIERINIMAWMAFIVYMLILLIDYQRMESDVYYEKEMIYKGLFWIHIAGVLYLVPIIAIRFNKERIYRREFSPVPIIYGTIGLLALTTIPQSILTFADTGHVTFYLIFILITNWAFALPHRIRIIFNLLSLGIMLFAIILIGRRDVVSYMISLYEVTGFTALAFIFGTFDLNLRASKYMDEKMLETEKNRIEELEKFKSSLYTNLTHEFRTPLTVISGMTDLSREYLEKQDVRAMLKSFDTIDRNNSDLLKLVNQMLDLSKLESSTMTLDLHQMDVVHMVEEIVDTFKPLAEKRNIELKVKLERQKILMDVDAEKFHSILSNLVSNAIKFTFDDGSVMVELLEKRIEGRDALHIKVQDTGYGIGEEHMPHIFDRFYQADTGPTRKTTGTGIGLALAKELIELMGGNIHVISELGKGTSFRLNIPITRNHSIKEPDFLKKNKRRVNKSTLDRKMRRQTVDNPMLLIIEDNEDVLSYLAALLEQEYNIEIARNGEEGLRKAITLIPDIIVSDIMMPIKDGLTLTSELKQNEITSHIPIILLTAKADFEDRLEGLATGADAYLTKPFKKEELLIRLEKLIELRMQLQQKYSQFALIDDPSALKNENSFIHKTNAIIQENIDNENFSVENLADALYISRMQLHRKLKALTNRSSSSYIRCFRLHRAKPMLKDISRTIGDVAFEVGFHDPNYFTKSFSKEFGVTPSEFRNS
jgi:signal transduction histidine kinase/DNA-binding response OmpR family regulator